MREIWDSPNPKPLMYMRFCGSPLLWFSPGYHQGLRRLRGDGRLFRTGRDECRTILRSAANACRRLRVRATVLMENFLPYSGDDGLRRCSAARLPSDRLVVP